MRGPLVEWSEYMASRSRRVQGQRPATNAPSSLRHALACRPATTRQAPSQSSAAHVQAAGDHLDVLAVLEHWQHDRVGRGAVAVAREARSRGELEREPRPLALRAVRHSGPLPHAQLTGPSSANGSSTHGNLRRLALTSGMDSMIGATAPDAAM